MNPYEKSERIRQLGNEIGYGHLMWEASQEWSKDLKRRWGLDGGQFAVGPCVRLTVPCGCESPEDCDWCCGSGWLTERVKKAKDQQ